MIRWYLKYRIRRAIGQQTVLPGWLQRKTDIDDELARYAKDYARMMRQLSSGAEVWMKAQIGQERPGWRNEVSAMLQSVDDNPRMLAKQPVPTAIRQPRFHGSPSLRWAACIVATVLLVCGLLVMHVRSNRSLARQESKQNAEMAVVATRAVMEKGYRMADQSRVAWERTLDKVSQNLVDRIGDSAVAPIGDGGRWMGEAISELHNGAVREQNGLVEMSKRIRNRFKE